MEYGNNSSENAYPGHLKCRPFSALTVLPSADEGECEEVKTDKVSLKLRSMWPESGTLSCRLFVDAFRRQSLHDRRRVDAKVSGASSVYVCSRESCPL